MDLTINLGHIIQLLALTGGFMWFVWEMRTKLTLLLNAQTNITDRIDKIDGALSQLAKITVEIARQDERMAAQDARIQEISNRLSEIILISPSIVRPIKRLKAR